MVIGAQAQLVGKVDSGPLLSGFLADLRVLLVPPLLNKDRIALPGAVEWLLGGEPEQPHHPQYRGGAEGFVEVLANQLADERQRPQRVGTLQLLRCLLAQGTRQPGDFLAIELRRTAGLGLVLQTLLSIAGESREPAVQRSFRDAEVLATSATGWPFSTALSACIRRVCMPVWSSLRASLARLHFILKFYQSMTSSYKQSVESSFSKSPLSEPCSEGSVIIGSGLWASQVQ